MPGLIPTQRTTVLISNFEEVGHGASTGIPSDCVELLAVDMAAVGEGQNSDEFSCGICVKDSGGPYHIEMRRKLVELAQNADIPYKLDVYPFLQLGWRGCLACGRRLARGIDWPRRGCEPCLRAHASRQPVGDRASDCRISRRALVEARTRLLSNITWPGEFHRQELQT